MGEVPRPNALPNQSEDKMSKSKDSLDDAARKYAADLIKRKVITKEERELIITTFKNGAFWEIEQFCS